VVELAKRKNAVIKITFDQAILDRAVLSLEEAGLITTSKDGRIRTCAIVPEALDAVRTWLDEQRAIWEARLDRLDAFVMNVMKENEE
jgi:DNA-binding transcriptional ArsR family regulator